MAADELVLADVVDGVATVTINRADKLNALNTGEMIRADEALRMRRPVFTAR